MIKLINQRFDKETIRRLSSHPLKNQTHSKQPLPVKSRQVPSNPPIQLPPLSYKLSITIKPHSLSRGNRDASQNKLEGKRKKKEKEKKKILRGTGNESS